MAQAHRGFAYWFEEGAVNLGNLFSESPPLCSLMFPEQTEEIDFSTIKPTLPFCFILD